MRKQDSLQGALDLMVLKILSRKPRLYGYAIMTAIEETSYGMTAAGKKQLTAEESRWQSGTSGVNRVLRMP
jgi:PadR family transcriptional regulator PadR